MKNKFRKRREKDKFVNISDKSNCQIFSKLSCLIGNFKAGF